MKTIMLFAGSMALGDAMVKTGTGSVIADIIVNSLGASPSPIVVLVVIFVLGVSHDELHVQYCYLCIIGTNRS